MHTDLDASLPGEPIRSTVCIVGGGIAGLILATRLARLGIDVSLLEAGGLVFEERSQDEYATSMAAERHMGSTEGRFRTFGGSSTRWGGQLLPYTSDIFNPPPGSPSAPWPIAEHALSPYYSEVQSLLGVDRLPFSGDLLASLGHPPLPASQDILVRFSKWAPFNRRNLAGTLGEEALAHPRIRVFTHANAVRLVADPGNPRRIGSVVAINYARQAFTFAAEHIVLCTGTIECSRLLLASGAAIPDPQDQIGRFFHDHVSFHAAGFATPERERVVELLGPFFVEGTTHTCKLEASAELRGRAGLHAVMAHVVIEEPADSGAAALRGLLRSLQRQQLRQAIAADLPRVVRGLGDVVRLILHARFKQRRAVSRNAILQLNIDVEQAPRAENRILLSPSGTTALGLPMAVVDWRVGRAEQETALRFLPVLRQFLDTLGIAPQAWAPGIEQGIPPAMEDTYHAMGGLRMGVDPAASVVDCDLLVHGLDNLSVASCAVYPSGGSSNPTFTLMALTLRLADHLARTLRAG